MKLDILAIGAHPDDVELGCSGTVLRQISLGNKVGILDLTRGELGTRGTPEIRRQEADAAARLLGVAARENLGMADGFFQNDREHQLAIVRVLRKYQPDIVLANAFFDRHPDHGRAANLIEDACFLSGLEKISTETDGKAQAAWRPKAVYHYSQARYIEPDFVVDISEFMEQKMQAILCYRSQFYDPENPQADTFISRPEFLEMVKARAAEHGGSIGVAFGEGFVSKAKLGVKDLRHLI